MQTLQENQKFVISLGVVTCIIGFGAIMAISSLMTFQTNEEIEFKPTIEIPIPENKIQEMNTLGDSQTANDMTISQQNSPEMLIIQNVNEYPGYFN